MDYITLIGIEYPNIEVTATEDPEIYENVIWLNPLDTISKVDLDARKLLVLKREKTISLSEDCKQIIISGFTSSALGSSMLYDSEEVDQLNLIGTVSTTAPTPAAASGYDSLYACRDVGTGIKEYRLHTHYQLRQVMSDGAIFKMQQLQKFHLLRIQVESATTEEEINGIKWN